ncbi:Oxysterol-binding protein-related protein 9 [Microtus ochrogaster]|uniref:Oxysterol-binding protein n=1 Tax=Microtus ochrogaster TaxID=79684 RepID=A0A8J6L2B1_MICOH|nr:Oxysterol-binding protein-related protein 9 [Microtus ochrogaster]
MHQVLMEHEKLIIRKPQRKVTRDHGMSLKNITKCWHLGAVIGIDDEDDSTFTITVDQKTFHFQARDADEREKWIHALEETILRHTLQLQGLDSGFVPSVQDFDKKLTEADAYLQILIEQLKLFDDKLQNCKDDEQRKSMVESIKHCIVLLQIAKDQSNAEQHADGIISTINPVDAIYQPSPLEPVISTMPSQTVLPPGSGNSPPSSSLTPPSHVNLSPNTVPEFSYSSSEDEFYDADEFHQSGSSPKRLIDPKSEVSVIEFAALMDRLCKSGHDDMDKVALVFGYSISSAVEHSTDRNRCCSSGSASVLTHSSSGNSLKRPDTTESLNSSMSNGTSDADLFDSHDDRDDEGEAGSVEEHKSVIMHLLSQVRLGMDLTKVGTKSVLPSKSSSISDQKDPRDRMVQVVKWYLSAFHAGRRGSVAKKPYNPILGEIFQCHWTLPNDAEESAELVSEGPVPWVSKNSVTFVAEQVSHHPPISAFYAECFNKKIQFNAHIWTKSKFLGMSIGVHNIGQVPWVELGGECNINCSKTGYSANIVFHTKPFYGGKKHRITAEIFSPNDKKSFCSIEGEWNGIMYAKYATGENTIFVDTKKLPIIKKKVRKLEDQNEYESRCLWKDVTFNLKIRDIDAATEAKHRLEERQRAEARERKEKEIQWETRLFHEDGECWVYDEPLLKRLGAVKH